MDGLSDVVEDTLDLIDPVGAAVGIYRDGEPLHRQGYGWADVDRQRPFEADTCFRCCSVTKQFVAALVLIAESEGRLALSDAPADHLPWFGIRDRALTLRHLATNQSGVPDYWCHAMLTGAQPESPFRAADGRRLVERVHALDFSPGARFAYSNTNFLILGWVIEAVYGRTLADVLDDKILAPLGMHSSALAPRTHDALPSGAVGYETDADGRAVPALVNIEWFGDAGLASTVEDLARWARLFDGHGPRSLVNSAERLIAPGAYNDGQPAPYRLGISRTSLANHVTLIHFGALRGWRMVLMHLPERRLSVVAAFNSMADPAAFARRVGTFLLTGNAPAVPRGVPDSVPPQRYLCAALGQLVEVRRCDDRLRIDCGGRRHDLNATEHSFRSADGMTLATVTDTSGDIRYGTDNVTLTFSRWPNGDGPPAGRYVCDALDSTLHITADRQTVRFSGPLGESTPLALGDHGHGLAAVRCPRALDHPAPGTFTLAFDPEHATLNIGCWAAAKSAWTLR